MALIKFRSALNDRQALVPVTLKPSAPTVPLGASPEAPFQLIISLHIVSSTEPGRPITICTNGTAFHVESEGIDTLARPAFGNLVNVSDSNRNIHLGRFMINRIPSDHASSPDLRKRGLNFITIPGDGSSVEIAHPLPLSRMFRYAEGIEQNDLVSGERYRVHVNDGSVGTTWWCWGGLEDELKDKKLCAWQEGSDWNDVKRPSDEDIQREGWVLGEDLGKLWFEDEPEGGRFAEFEFVD